MPICREESVPDARLSYWLLQQTGMTDGCSEYGRLTEET